MSILTNEDWTEIYYALVDKQARLDGGEIHVDGLDEFSDHLGTIIDKIGPDGEDMFDKEAIPCETTNI